MTDKLTLPPLYPHVGVDFTNAATDKWAHEHMTEGHCLRRITSAIARHEHEMTYTTSGNRIVVSTYDPSCSTDSVHVDQYDCIILRRRSFSYTPAKDGIK